MIDDEKKYDFSEFLKTDIPRITDIDKASLMQDIISTMLVQSTNSEINKSRAVLRLERKKERKLKTFVNFVKKCCDQKECSLCQQQIECTECLLEQKHIKYALIDSNLFYYCRRSIFDFFNTEDIYLLKNDIDSLGKRLMSPLEKMVLSERLWHKVLTGKNKIYPCEQQKISRSEIAVFVEFHKSYVKNKQPRQINIFNLQYHILYKFIIAQKLFYLKKAEGIISSTGNLQERTELGINEFRTFVEENFQIVPNSVNNLLYRLSGISDACKKQRCYSPIKAFSKLLNTLYAISDGQILTIKQLAVMLAKIFIGREYLKKFNPNMDNFTIIVADNSSYIRDFLKDMLTYQLSPKNIDYDRNGKFIKRRGYESSWVTEHNSTYLCKKENLKNLIKEKILGCIVNIDISDATIERGIFSTLLSNKEISGSDNGILGKLKYRSNLHYIKICNSVKNFDLNGTTELSYDSIVFSGKLHNAKYNPLDAYELFFFVTAILEYGVSLLECDLKGENIPPNKCYIKDTTATIIQFVQEFYIDTFDLKQASHLQRNDKNSFVASDENIYPKYVKWFESVYPGIQPCSKEQVKEKLKQYYCERKSGSNPEGLNEKEQQEELKHRYYKNNKENCRGISGLEFNEEKYHNFFNQFQRTTDNDEENRKKFFEYIEKEIFEKCYLHDM